MKEQELEQVIAVLDVSRTDSLLDSAISRAGSFEKGRYSEEDLKKQRLVLGFGNLHINTARAKISAVRFIGYRNGLRDTKNAVERKLHESRDSRASREMPQGGA